MEDPRRELRLAGRKKNLIIALEVAHNSELFRCETCTWGRHCDDSRPAPFAKWVVRNRAGGVLIESKTCLLPMVTEESQFLVRLHGHNKNQVLPYSGGLLEQPHRYAEAMEILGAREAEILADQAERR